MSASISEFQKTCLRKFSALVMFLDISSTILWRCKLKSPQNGNLKKRIIHLSRNITHMTYTTFIFVKVFWIRTNIVNVRAKNSIKVLINIRVNYCALRWIAWKEWVRANVIRSQRSKQGHIVRFVCSVFFYYSRTVNRLNSVSILFCWPKTLEEL